MEEGKSGGCNLYWLARSKATVAENATVRRSAPASIGKPAPQELFEPMPNMWIENISPFV
jgi:hypothetical protein